MLPHPIAYRFDNDLGVFSILADQFVFGSKFLKIDKSGFVRCGIYPTYLVIVVRMIMSVFQSQLRFSVSAQTVNDLNQIAAFEIIAYFVQYILSRFIIPFGEMYIYALRQIIQFIFVFRRRISRFFRFIKNINNNEVRLIEPETAEKSLLISFNFSSPVYKA